MTTEAPTAQIVRSEDRRHWWDGAIDSRQSFPATGNFDLARAAHGLLLVHNEDTVAPGEGFDRHHHRAMEIVTWVLDGRLRHEDSVGNTGVLRPGVIQRMSAGSGVLHSERNDNGYTSRRPLRVVQMWIPPSVDDTEPSYEERDVSDALAGGELIVVASGLSRDADRTAVTLGNRDAALHIARPSAGRSITVPDAPFVHVFVARGDATMGGVELRQGDAVRLTGGGADRITATAPSEILIWEMHSAAE
ncbi:pirin family protein [Rhodococcoides corynebacterioides]|uniref:pirin family protein n=1 Tax=Rhodococcoides corynebacterioides TaxID=53972 RepID=UPI001C9A9657|nr:pirin family protein [Rhodococcus corynebacterioides]MBY6363941.1 pirin family protein [Rhodococcus corynebacterioides]